MFKNSSELGSFGEFVYLKFVQLNGLKIEKKGIFEHDFIIDNKFLVDVKTTEKNKSRWSGKRTNSDFIYDLIVVHGGLVKIYPDKNSPLINHFGNTIGDTKKLYLEWVNFKKENKVNPNRKVKNKHTLNRNIIKDKIISAFKKTSYKKIRCIFRGSVSKTRWKSSPDNLPGSSRKIKDNDVTVFIQMKSNNYTETVSKIFLIIHNSLSDIEMKKGDARQIKKGILNVVDLEWFSENKGDLVFDSVEDLEIFITK